MPSSFFADHFSGHASEYARFRPDYPPDLFDYLAELAPARRRAWDCATGSGQAAAGLAKRFSRVVATDASARQLSQARSDPRILYAVAAAEAAPLSDRSLDLVTVAQALHWFDRPRFWAEAARVLVPGGVVAAWLYGILRVTEDVDRVVSHFYRDVVGPFWPGERRLVEAGYGVLEFPFEEIRAPAFEMEKSWRLADLVGYLRTWSSTRRYVEARGEDPIRRVEGVLREAWGDPEAPRRILWDLDLRVGRTSRAA